MHKDHYENVICVVRGTKVCVCICPFVSRETVTGNTTELHHQRFVAISSAMSRDHFAVALLPRISMSPRINAYPIAHNSHLCCCRLRTHRSCTRQRCCAGCMIDLGLKIKSNYTKFCSRPLDWHSSISIELLLCRSSHLRDFSSQQAGSEFLGTGLRPRRAFLQL